MKNATKKEKSSDNLREVFLKNFVQSIMENFQQQEIPIVSSTTSVESLEKEEFQPSRLIQEAETLPLPETPKQAFMPQIKKALPPKISPQLNNAQPQRPLPPIPRNFPRSPLPPPPLSSAPTPSLPLGKITSFLNDPSVAIVECPGPEQNIIIIKGGRTQTVPLALTKEEIDEIMIKVAKQTKIPLSTGVFKAALSNFVISAVISEFVGTRFNIEKLRPNTPSPFPQPSAHRF